MVDRTTASVLNELFFTANAQERRLILLNFDVVAPVPAGRVGVSFDPSVGRRLEAAALAGNNEEFAQLLARALRISREQARRMARDELGEPVAVAGKALGLARDVLHRILLFVNPAVGHSVERVHALAALYDAMTPQAAQGMVEIWQALPQNERAGAKHQPLTWDEVMRRVRAPRRRPRALLLHRERTNAAMLLESRFCSGVSEAHSDVQPVTTSRKFRPARSSTSTIQTSGSNFTCRAR